jgi:hypothetical protein
MNFLDMQVVYISCYITTIKYKKNNQSYSYDIYFKLRFYHCVLHEEMNKTRFYLRMFQKN